MHQRIVLVSVYEKKGFDHIIVHDIVTLAEQRFDRLREMR